jgi:uncharacterized protein YdaT
MIPYTREKFPEKMKGLPEEIRHQAIRFTNEMMVDGDVRHHEDLIIAIAIQKAMKWDREQKRAEQN